MNIIAYLVLASGVVFASAVQAKNDDYSPPARSLGFTNQSPSDFSDGRGAEIAFRVSGESSTAWVLSGNGSLQRIKDGSPSSYESASEYAAASVYLGKRRYFGSALKTRLFSEGLFGGVADSRKRTSAGPVYVGSEERFNSYSRSVTLGLGVRGAFGGEYFFYPRVGVEIKTSIEYRRLIWNFAGTSNLHRSTFSTAGQVGLNWYW